ncbi:hypothetical protein L1887_48054 [Cichorium endivia]|nr:hypothetical protein L1887_48054 [Cichorium endivia]
MRSSRFAEESAAGTMAASLCRSSTCGLDQRVMRVKCVDLRTRAKHACAAHFLALLASICWRGSSWVVSFGSCRSAGRSRRASQPLIFALRTAPPPRQPRVPHLREVSLPTRFRFTACRSTASQRWDPAKHGAYSAQLHHAQHRSALVATTEPFLAQSRT